MISYVGLKKLRPLEIKQVEQISRQNFTKIQRNFNNSDLIIHIKKNDEHGKVRFSVNLKLDDDSIHNVLTANESDWDLQRVMHKVFDNLNNELNHKFKTR